MAASRGEHHAVARACVRTVTVQPELGSTFDDED
jgi:hypothetical protein